MPKLTRHSRVFSKVKPKKTLEWQVDAPNRAELRRVVVTKWLEEDEHTDYRYNVERCDDSSRLYLVRPTFLNKGFDFRVNLEGFRSVTRDAKGPTKEMPSHTDVLNDIKRKVKAHPKNVSALHAAISDVFDCGSPADVLKRHPQVRALTAGLPAQKLLLILKWLFIEQDITYWLQTGRNMLMSGIEREAFRLN
jgi:hypothetical protein